MKSLLEEARIEPLESLLQYVGGKVAESQEENVLLSLHPYSSNDFQIGREDNSWLKSPPMIIGPGQDEVAVTLVSEVVSSLSVQHFRLSIIGLGVTINGNAQDFKGM